MSKDLKQLFGNISPTKLVSKLKKELQNLDINNSELETIISELSDINYALDHSSIVAVTDRRGIILSVNDTFCEISKYSREELIGKNHRVLKSKYHSDEFFAHMWNTIKSGNVWRGEVKNRAKDDSYYWVKTAIFPFLDENGNPYKYVSVRTDITEGKLYEEKLRKLLKNDFSQVMNNLDNFVFKLKRVEQDYVYTLIAGNLAKELGLREEDHLHKSVFDIFPEEAISKISKPVRATFSGEKSKCEVYFNKKHLFLTLSPIYRNGVIEEIVGSVSDITDLKNSELVVKHMAYHDSLTDLPNRRMLDNDLMQCILTAKEKDINVGVLFIDLDHFKQINDTLGHHVGDYILIMAAHRLQKMGLSEFVAKHTLYHLGGDEFVFVICDFEEDAVHEACQFLLKAFESPFLYKQADIHLNISIGISVYPTNAETSEDLVKNADIALFAAKNKGRNTYLFFTDDMNKSLIKKLQIENDLRKALATNNQLQLYYQPQVDLQTNRIVGVEALIRWIHPEKGFIPPLDFIQVAEDNGLIIPLGDWVLEQACAQIKEWQNSGFEDLRVSVNIANKQFQHPNFTNNVFKVLQEAQLSPQSLELEITENSLMDNTKATIDTLTKLKEHGIQIAIDDFGTGYSSLSYLKVFPITTLKIDQTFVYELPEDNGDRAIVSSIINLAQNLGLRVIAEGVENKEALLYLKENKCNEMQGYYFSRPIPATEMKQLLITHNSSILE